MTDDENLTKEICNLNTTHHQPLPSPSPRPSPQGRGRHLTPLSEQRGVADGRRTGKRFSLSPRERAGVRGKPTYFSAMCPRLVAKICVTIFRHLLSQNQILLRLLHGEHSQKSMKKFILSPAFTLLELLTVISIVSILAGLLLPS